ncbi:MAG: cell envelope integrity protein CreD [Desulfuromusa sp.]
MSTQNTVKKTGDFIRNSATLKIVSIGILILVLLIPTSMISSLLRERESRRDYVVAEINQKWGNIQTISGPFFTVPYKSFYKDENEKLKFNIRFFHVLPEKLNISGTLDPHIRYRSIYEAVLYNTQINISGHFTLPNMSQTSIDPDNIFWDKAIFSLGITDMKGIQENIEIIFNEKKYAVSPGLKTTDIASAGVSSMIPFPQSDSSSSFSLRLNLNGSEQIQFIPVAEETNVEISSSWPSPSFNGAFLPTTREVTASGFSAAWKVLHLNRNFPQFWEGNQYQVDNASFGLKLLITADIYQKSTRISKYAIMFIVFTFAAFFFSEIINKNRVHPIQYLLIGLAVILFYVLLLSISEHLNFDFAYILSATAVTLLITGYSMGILKNKYFTFTVFAILSILYAYLYIVLQLEDYALIMGSTGLLAVLGTVMYITRKIDWYAIENNPDE